MKKTIVIAVAGVASAFVACANPNAGGLDAAKLSVCVDGKSVTDCERRDFDDGCAVRYRIPEGAKRVERETTEWVLPEDAVCWYQPNANYEAPYKKAKVGEIKVGAMMALPVVFRLADGTYRLITEANVVGWTDLAVVYDGKGVFRAYYYADRDGFELKGERVSPWRVTIVAKDVDVLGTSDMVRRLCPEPSAEVAARCATFVKPGKCIWQWLPDGGPVLAEQRQWYDRTAALGFPYYLIDAGWKDWKDATRDQWTCLADVIAYGKSIGVESFMWVDSKEIKTAEARRAYLDKVKASGAVGIKIDFVPTPSRKVMDWYEETLKDTFARGLMTDFHGCVKPSGRERTWPHEIAREAVRGHEYHITRYKRVLPPEHDTIIPFSRAVQGHFDYTPVVFEKKEILNFTWARQLAQGVVMCGRFLCFGDYPKNYLDSPANEFLRAMPPCYDETRYLPGTEIGECVVVAKRKGNRWFLAVENGAEDRKLAIRLDFLTTPCRMLSFADGPTVDSFTKAERGVKPGETLEMTVKANGGFAAMFGAAEPPAKKVCN